MAERASWLVLAGTFSWFYNKFMFLVLLYVLTVDFFSIPKDSGKCYCLSNGDGKMDYWACNELDKVSLMGVLKYLQSQKIVRGGPGVFLQGPFPILKSVTC